MAKLRYLSISDLIADSWLIAQLKTGFDSGRHPYRVIGGLPEDTKLVDIKLQQYPIKSILLVFYSESFEDVEDVYSLPSMTITVTNYEVNNAIQT